MSENKLRLLGVYEWQDVYIKVFRAIDKSGGFGIKNNPGTEMPKDIGGRGKPGIKAA